MADTPPFYSAGNIPQLVAENIVRTANAVTDIDPTVTAEYLGSVIAEIQPQTQTIGAALLNVDLIDPTWAVYRSGLCDRDADGLLPQVDVEYPPTTDVWWRLAYVQISNDLAGANLTMTFQHRPVAYWTQDWGPLSWKNLGGQGTTRAQFIKRMLSRVPKSLPKGVLGPGGSDIIFVSPELNDVQPVAGTNQAGRVVTVDQTTTSTQDKQTAAQQRAAAKNAGITLSSKVKIKGATPTATQVAVINALLAVGAELKAPTLALEAIIYAAMGETTLGADASAYQPNGFATSYSPQGFWGVLQGAVSYWPDPHDTAGMATAFFNGDDAKGFNGGGAINLVKSGVTNPAEIAIKVEVPSIWPDDAYAKEWTGGATQGLAEAKAIVAAGGNGGLVSSDSTTGTGQSDIAELSRGTTSVPDEDSWTCAQRLASEVNWLLFTSPYEGGRWGNFVYYLDGPTAVKQQPAIYLELNDAGTEWTLTNGQGGSTTISNNARTDGGVMSLTGSTDNTSFVFQETLPVKGKTKRKTTIRMPQSPTQAKFNLFAGVFEFNAGQVAVFHNAGGLNGRWIITDVTHNSLQDLYAQLTLGPSTYPYPEPQAQKTNSSASSTTSTTVAAGSVQGYANPLAKLKDLKSGRIDQGVDYSGSGPLLAIGNAQVVYATNTDGGWPPFPGGAITLLLSDGVYAGKYVYYTENITVRQDLINAIDAGQKPVVKAGDTIATLYDAAPNMEIGWASGPGSTPLAGALGQNAKETGQGNDPGDVQSAAGINFNELLKAVGAPSGGPGSGPKSTGPGMPAGWPTLTGTTVTLPTTPGAPASPASLPLSGTPVQQGAQGAVQTTAAGVVTAGLTKALGGIFGSVFDRPQ